MRGLFVGCCAVVLSCGSTVLAQTYEELQKENRKLRARLAALEAGKALEEAQEQDQKDKTVVVRYEAATGRLVVQTGGKERTYELKPATHVHDVDGTHVQPANRAAKLIAGVEVTVIEEAGQVAEVNILGGGKHVHDHAHDGAGHDHCQKPKDRFDFFRCFKSHIDDHEDGDDGHSHDADGHSHDADGHSHDADGHSHDADGHSHDADGHSHDGDDYGHDHSHVMGHDRHESIEGYHFFHPLRTEHAFIERVTVLGLNRTKGAEAGTRDDLNLGYELFLPLNNRFAVVVEGDVQSQNPDEGPALTGFGDLEIGFRFVAYNGPHMILTAGLGVDVPTGDPDHFGEGHAALAPGLFNLIDFGRGWVLQSQFQLELPLSVREDVENEFFYNVALGKTLMSTVRPHEAHDPHGVHDVTPFVELNGLTVLNGEVYGTTQIDVTPGLFFVLGKRNEFNFGASIPVSGVHAFDYQFLMSWIRHF